MADHHEALDHALASFPCWLPVAPNPKSADYAAVLDDAGGLKPGAVVYIAGVEVGRVNQVRLDGTRAAWSSTSVPPKA